MLGVNRVGGAPGGCRAGRAWGRRSEWAGAWYPRKRPGDTPGGGSRGQVTLGWSPRGPEQPGPGAQSLYLLECGWG